MNDSVKNQVLKSWERIDCPKPIWLEDGKEPNLKTIEQGSSGPTIIFLHGLFGALSNWDTTLPLISHYSKTIALHFPIMGGHKSEVKVKPLALLTEYYIRKNNLGPVVLCGNSLGGHVALRLTLNSPELVKGLVLSGSSGLYEHTSDTLPIRPGAEFIRDHMKRVFFNDRFITDEAVNEILTTIKQRSNHLNIIQSARSAKKDNLQKVLPAIKVPTLLLWGEDDEITTMQVAQIFKDSMPNSELTTIKNCGHAPMIEYPEWFSEQVKTFIDKQGW
jgi:pimeloyl-ACP methyl ester carboxylesterase